LLKNLSADGTVIGIAKNILKIIQIFGNNLNSHSIRPYISLRRKFNNQQNAQHTFAMHYKHLRPALQLLVNFELLSYYLTHMRNIRGLLLLD